MKPKENIYILSPVRNVTNFQRIVINKHLATLPKDYVTIFDPLIHAPQQDPTGIRIVQAEYTFLKKIQTEGGKVHVLWNRSGTPSEGSRVDWGMIRALRLAVKLVYIFQENEITGPQQCYELLKYSTFPYVLLSSFHPLCKKVDQYLRSIQNQQQVPITWTMGMTGNEEEWQRIQLGLIIGSGKIPTLEKLNGTDVSAKSYVKVIKNWEK